MQKLIKQSVLITAILIATLMISCDDTETGGYGRYMIGIDNQSNNNYSVAMYLDGVNQGSMVVLSGVNGVGYCDNIVLSAQKQNVRIFDLVPTGDHTLVLKDDSDGYVFFTLDFTITPDGCSYQPLQLN